MNLLNKAFDTPFNTAPFSKIKPQDFMPAFQHAIEESRKNIDVITSSNYPPNFNNTIEALEFSSLGLERISSIFFNLNADLKINLLKLTYDINSLLRRAKLTIKCNNLINFANL